MRALRLLFLDFQVPYLLKDAEYPVGGACVRQVSLARGLASLGHKVGILTWKGAGEYAGGGQPFDLVESYYPDSGLRKLRYFYHRFPSLLRAARSFRPDYIFQKCFGSDTATMAAIARLLKVPFVYMAANDIDADGGYRKRLGLLERVAYAHAIRKADVIIAQNGYQLREFRKWLGGKSIAVVHNPVSFGEGPLPPIKPHSGRGYFAWLGVFQPQKNLPALLDIARNTPEAEFRVGGMLKIGGREDMKEVVRNLSALPNVRIVGYLRRSEVIPFLGNAIALLNTSHYEGFSNTLLEAWLSGTPAVTSSIDPDDIIANNGLGTVAGNYKEVPGVLRSLMTDPGFDELAARCRAYVLKNHNERTIAERFVASLPRKPL